VEKESSLQFLFFASFPYSYFLVVPFFIPSFLISPSLTSSFQLCFFHFPLPSPFLELISVLLFSRSFEKWEGADILAITLAFITVFAFYAYHCHALWNRKQKGAWVSLAGKSSSCPSRSCSFYFLFLFFTPRSSRCSTSLLIFSFRSTFHCSSLLCVHFLIG
jgi:hypothetical protein